ncbi:MAG: gluconate 2-dehydrogenase subunit 3 family protein [Gammaproteobacteria bacterium]|nr:gluconate 2-dehydrogenase subunit 3 family protein [Gammaproteobacteria bacterium]MYE30679.1 gluconate 2-dehydrogenase subunit 3 family protein [Gammaproteobacteria bacterium]
MPKPPASGIISSNTTTPATVLLPSPTASATCANCNSESGEMLMKTRREFLRELIISVGGVSALSACGDAPVVVATVAGEPGRFYNAEEMELVSRLSELIIPRTETPGALEVNVPGYIDGLMTDWASEETRTAHRQALAEIERRLSADGSFLALDEVAAEQVLADLDRSAFAEAADELGGYRSFKGYVTRSYFATEGGAREEQRWVAVPGRWDPDVLVTDRQGV